MLVSQNLMLDMLFFCIELHLLRVQRWGFGRIKTFLLSLHHGSGLAVSCSLSVSEYRVDQSYPNNRIRVAFCDTRAAFSANHDTKPLLSRRWRKSPVALCSGHKLCVLVTTLYWETLLFVPTSNGQVRLWLKFGTRDQNIFQNPPTSHPSGW